MSHALPLVPSEPAADWPGVSVVIAAKDASATLGDCLASLRAQDYPEREILVVDDGSSDDTAAVALAGGARVLSAPRPGPSAARNFGIEHAAHEIVAFTDADCVVDPQWLRALVDGLRVSKAAGVGGPQRNVFPADAGQDVRDLDLFFSLASVLAEYTRGDDRAREVDHNASCNAAYVKHTILEAGGFDEALFPGEDVDLDYRLRRLGYRCFYTPEAGVAHHRPGTRTWFARMMRRYGRAQGVLVRKHGRFRPLHYLPVVTTGLLLAQGLWLRRRTRVVALACDGVLVGSALAVLWSRVPVDRWPAVLDYAALAMTQWHRGYWEGVRG